MRARVPLPRTEECQDAEDRAAGRNGGEGHRQGEPGRLGRVEPVPQPALPPRRPVDGVVDDLRRFLDRTLRRRQAIVRGGHEHATDEGDRDQEQERHGAEFVRIGPGENVR